MFIFSSSNCGGLSDFFFPRVLYEVEACGLDLGGSLSLYTVHIGSFVVREDRVIYELAVLVAEDCP